MPYNSYSIYLKYVDILEEEHKTPEDCTIWFNVTTGYVFCFLSASFIWVDDVGVIGSGKHFK